MKAKLLAICLIFSIFTGAALYAAPGHASAPESNNAEASYDLAVNALLYLRALRSDGTVTATGSGVIVSAGGTALTAYHVVKGAERIEGVMSDGRTIGPITVANFNELTDAAAVKLPDPKLMKIKGNSYPSLPIRKEGLRFGEKVFALGYPLKNTPIITEGIVNNPRAKINGRDRILASSQIVSGMSGGPLLDQRGQLAGIISGSLRTMDNIHLAVDTGDLAEVLPDALK